MRHFLEFEIIAVSRLYANERTILDAEILLDAVGVQVSIVVIKSYKVVIWSLRRLTLTGGKKKEARKQPECK